MNVDAPKSPRLPKPRRASRRSPARSSCRSRQPKTLETPAPQPGEDEVCNHQPSRRRQRSPLSDDSFEERSRKSRRRSVEFTAEDIIKLLTTVRSESSKISHSSMTNQLLNVVPEFDPNNKTQTVERWLIKVNECASIYEWNEKQLIHYSLQKLVGLAKTWYESLPSVNYTWTEWQNKLRRAFPSEVNYGKLLEDMLCRVSRPDEGLKDYFYDKLTLLSRCEIVGRKTVDCIVHGITNSSIRNGAQALKEPEDMLTYLASQQLQHSKQPAPHSSNQYRKRDNNGGYSHSYNKGNITTATSASNLSSGIICFNCHDKGHWYTNCPKSIVKCQKCGRIGHNIPDCGHKPINSHNSTTIQNNSVQK